MDVRVRGRNTVVDERLREMAASKVAHAGRFFEGILDADVEFTEEQNRRVTDGRFKVEVTSRAAGQMMRVESTAESAEAALDLVVDKMEKRLRRLKERLVQRSRKGRREAEFGFADLEDDDGEGPEVVRVKQFVMKPMTPEEAALQMDLLGHSFFFFQNAESDMPSVLYRRRDGALGLIEPA
ncbi:MAG: ribosome-associated translation inhibitor RaiA [Acidimicrobiia bacterium]|nr:ribosome-associated translation inhibitor RaiA [Acidimicrobiia bacterium]